MLEASTPNIVSALLAGFVSLVCTFGVVVFTDKRKIRVTASEREVEARADFVELLQKRVVDLEGRLDMAARREAEMTNDFRRQYHDLERRYRHLVAGLVTYSVALTYKLKQLGVTDIPEFTGWGKFMEEGGDLNPQWQETLNRMRETEC